MKQIKAEEVSGFGVWTATILDLVVRENYRLRMRQALPDPLVPASARTTKWAALAGMLLPCSLSMMLKKMENNVWARKQPCLTLLEMRKLPDRDPLCFTSPFRPSWSWRRMVRNLKRQPRCAKIFHGQLRLTVSRSGPRKLHIDPCSVLCPAPTSASARRSCLSSLCWT